MAKRGEKYWEYSFRPQYSSRAQHDESPRRPSGRPCAGPCNSRYRKAQEAVDAYEAADRAWQDNPAGNPPAEPEVPQVSPWPGDPVFCARCCSIIRRELAELDDLAAIRTAMADGHRKGPGADRVSGSRSHPSPSAAVDDVDELASMLRGWESVARGEDSTPPRRGYLALEVTTVISWLVAHWDTIIGNPDWAIDFAQEIRQWHRRLRDAEKAGTGRHPRTEMPCPRCARFTLVQEDGADYIECEPCGRLMKISEYEAAVDAWNGSASISGHSAA